MVMFTNLYHFRFCLSTSGFHYLLMELPEIWYIKVFEGEKDDDDTFNPVGRGAGVLARTPNYYYYMPQCKKLYIGPGPRVCFASYYYILLSVIVLRVLDGLT